MTDPLTPEELAAMEVLVEQGLPITPPLNWFPRLIATIDARDATIRNTQYLADKMSARAAELIRERDEARQWRDLYSERLAAAEATIATLREALERIADDTHDHIATGPCWCEESFPDIARAALSPQEGGA